MTFLKKEVADKSMKIAAVVGNEVSIFDKPNSNGRRKLLRVRQFSNHGQALMFAREYEDVQREQLAIV